MSNNYCIYMHTNKINGKKYIGQTCQKPEYRWNNGKGYKECSLFYAAILKYGWDNFDHTILHTNLTIEEANQLEEYYIALYHSNEEDFGYNLQAGGANRAVSPLTKQKCSEHAKQMWTDDSYRQHMSDIMKKKWKDPSFQEKQRIARESRDWSLSEEGRASISRARKEYIAQHGTPTEGVGHTQETKQKISESMMGEKNHMYGKTQTDKQKQIAKECNSVKVQCIETGQIFNSRKEAAEWCGLKSASGISEYLAGKKKSAGKHPITGEKLHWKSLN